MLQVVSNCCTSLLADPNLFSLDHICLNDILPNPTAEMIAQWIAERLKKEMEPTSIRLCSLKLWEGKNKWVLLD